jgi:hypothetical protein
MKDCRSDRANNGTVSILANCYRDVATDEVRKGEIGCVFDEMQNLVEPIERRYMDVSAGPHRGSVSWNRFEWWGR